MMPSHLLHHHGRVLYLCLVHPKPTHLREMREGVAEVTANHRSWLLPLTQLMLLAPTGPMQV
jgi:hypothetical protein